MTRGDEQWGRGDSGDPDWDDWNSPSEPETARFHPVGAWDTMASGSSGWDHADGGVDAGAAQYWNQPTEPRSGSKRWPIVVAASAAVVALMAAAVVALVMVSRGGGAEDVQAAATTAPRTSAWTTNSVAPTTTDEPTVVPAAPAQSEKSACTAADVARDTGRRVDSVVCYGDWAVAVTNAHGNAVRKVNGRWTVTGYSASSCTGDQGRAEIPTAMFEDHFVYCPTTRSSSPRETTRPRSSTSRSSAAAPRPVETPPAPEPAPSAPPVADEPLSGEEPAPLAEDPTEEPQPSVSGGDDTD